MAVAIEHTETGPGKGPATAVATISPDAPCIAFSVEKAVFVEVRRATMWAGVSGAAAVMQRERLIHIRCIPDFILVPKLYHKNLPTVSGVSFRGLRIKFFSFLSLNLISSGLARNPGTLPLPLLSPADENHLSLDDSNAEGSLIPVAFWLKT